MNCHRKQQKLCEIIEIAKRDDSKLLNIYCKIENFTGRQFQPESVNCLSRQEKNRMLCAIIEFLESNDCMLKEIHRQVKRSSVIDRDLLTREEHLNMLAQPKVSLKLLLMDLPSLKQKTLSRKKSSSTIMK